MWHVDCDVGNATQTPAGNGGGTMNTIRLVPSAIFCMVLVIPGMHSRVWATPGQVQDTSRHLYDRVMEEFKHRDYEAALAGFRLFLELHGQTSLAANAQYWVGECQYRMGRYREALKAFYNVVSYYPLSPKLAASTLKIGQTDNKLKDQERARMMFQRVVDQYPDSTEAEVARKALELAAEELEAEKIETEKPTEPSIVPAEPERLDPPASF